MAEKKQKGNMGNRGSSMVMALVAVAFVAVLGTTIITMAVSALKMKSMEARAKKAYYNADMAVDEIYSGLGREAYLQVGNAYEYVISNLLKVEGDAIAMVSNEEANAVLRRSFYEFISRELFADCCVDGGVFAPESALSFGGSFSGMDNAKVAAMLTDYLSDGYKSDPDIFLSVEVNSGPAVNMENKDGEYVISSVSINDVTVTYKNEVSDYFSQITVDFHIRFPENAVINIVDNTSDILLSFKDYAFVSDERVESGNYVTVNGGVYGQKGIELVGSPAAAAPVSMTMSGGNLVTKGDVKLTNNAGLIFDNGRIWANNIELAGGAINISGGGSAYIKDDLTLTENTSVKNSAVITGSYYGYSMEGYGISASDASPDKSSAVIVNSKNSRLDLSGIKTLVLGGYGWVVYDEANNYFYRTGESIAIKDNQVAYIMPGAWSSSGTLVIPDNFFAKTLLGSPAYIAHIDGEGNQVYYYNFVSGDASASFFRALYSESEFLALCQDGGITDIPGARATRDHIRSRVDEAYLAYLAEGAEIRINPNARVYAKGIVRENADSIDEYNGIGDEKVKQLYYNSSHRYKLVGSLLIELSEDWNYVASEWTVTAGKVLNYDNMRHSYEIRQAEDLSKGALENILLGADKIFGTAYYYVEDESGNNAEDYLVFVRDGNVSVSEFPVIDGKRRGMIIARGSVTADADFEGSILALGDIYVTGGTYTADPSLIEEIMKKITGILGYFDGKSDVSYQRHDGYNDSHKTPAAEEETGNLNGYGPSDCVDIKNYRKSGYASGEDE